jgi:hypothetical protein
MHVHPPPLHSLCGFSCCPLIAKDIHDGFSKLPFVCDEAPFHGSGQSGESGLPMANEPSNGDVERVMIPQLVLCLQCSFGIA